MNQATSIQNATSSVGPPRIALSGPSSPFSFRPEPDSRPEQLVRAKSAQGCWRCCRSGCEGRRRCRCSTWTSDPNERAREAQIKRQSSQAASRESFGTQRAQAWKRPHCRFAREKIAAEHHIVSQRSVSRTWLTRASKEIQQHVEESRTVYCGVDPTAASLHIGNLLPLVTLLRFQAAGHQAIAVVRSLAIL